MIPRIKIKNQWIPDHEPGEGDIPEYWHDIIEVEVLTVHFKSNKMRIRRHGRRMADIDIPADEFFEQVDIQIK